MVCGPLSASVTNEYSANGAVPTTVVTGPSANAWIRVSTQPTGRIQQPLSEVVMASANAHKVTEIEAILRATMPGLVVLPRPADGGDVIEDSDSLLGNARLKAHALAQATGKPAVADDTGLFVDALGGDPGVDTAYYAGNNATYSQNCQKLLIELHRVGASTPSQRTASFVTVAMVAWPDGGELWAEGRVKGIITTAAQGDGGFGYDPIFAPLEMNRSNVANTASAANTASPENFDPVHLQTFSELGEAAKNTMSHRSRAFVALAALLSA